MKQETLEEASMNWDYLSFEAGAKWQQERSYSEKEVKQILDATLIEYSNYVLADIPEWFERFKKK